MANSENVPIDKLYSKEETINYCRIILLMMDVGTETLLHLFYSLVPKQTVIGYFASMKSKIEDGKRKKVFDKSQYAKLTCPHPNPDEFDISLLFKVLTYFKLSPVKVHDLQTIRNEIVGHQHRAELITQEFQSLWVKVESILLRIARCVSEEEEQVTKVKITQLKEKVLDVSDREQKIIKIFETWWQEEIAVLHGKLDYNQEQIAVLHEESYHNQEQMAVLQEMSGHNQEQIAVLHEESYHNQGQITVLQENIQSLHDKVSESQHPANRQSTLNVLLQQDLIAHYRKWFSKLTLSPLIDEDDYAVNFLEIYVKPILAFPSHQDPKRQSIPVKSCHDIFVKDSKPCQNIYISSPAGCGKTSLARWLALTWCQAHQPIVEDNKWFIGEDVNEMRTFVFLFILFLRDEHEQECDVDIMIQNQLLLKIANSATYAEKGLKFVQKLLSSVKCIIILDGLDEWNHPHGNECKLHNKQTPYIRARPLCTTLITSRPWKLDVVGLKPGEIDQKLELNGLEGDLLKCLIDNVLKKMNTVHGKEMKACQFELELLDKKLTALSKIPVVVMQLLCVWFDNKPLGKSQCEIYSNMIEFLLKRYCEKREIVSQTEDMKVDDSIRDSQTPMCLQNQMYCNVHMKLLSKLATLAYNTLFTDDEESSLVFDRRIAMKYLTHQEITMSLAVGILTQEKGIGKMSIRQSHISFLHKTFQEYLAALYVTLSRGTVTDVEDKIRRVCCSIEKILTMSQIFMFVSGQCPEVMINLHEHLRQIVSEDSDTLRYRASCELHPEASTEGKTLMLVQNTMKEWLGECWMNGHKLVTYLPVSDFFIVSPSRWSAELKSLIVHNPVFSLYVIGKAYLRSDDDEFSLEEIQDLLDSVTEFNSIQKLWLWNVSVTFIVQLVSQHRHSLKVRPKTWRHLECVTLEWVVQDIPGDILCSLVESTLQLPMSVQVRLVECRVKQGTRNWKAYIRSHTQLTVDIVDYHNVYHYFYVKLLQFHTKSEHVPQYR